MTDETDEVEYGITLLVKVTTELADELKPLSEKRRASELYGNVWDYLE